MKMHRIKEALKASDFSQREMANIIGVSQTAMSSICRSESQPKLETLFKIARALKISPRELLIEPDWDTVTDEDFEK